MDRLSEETPKLTTLANSTEILKAVEELHKTLENPLHVGRKVDLTPFMLELNAMQAYNIARIAEYLNIIVTAMEKVGEEDGGKIKL